MSGLLAVVALEAVAVAAWLAPASVHIVEWTNEGPYRVALFASQRLLMLLLAAGGIAGGAVGLFARNRTRLLAAGAWLCLLWLWVVPFLPWLPDRFPLLLLFAGPLRWVVAGVAMVGAITEAVDVRGRRLQAAPEDKRGRRVQAALEKVKRMVRLKADPTLVDPTGAAPTGAAPTGRRAIFLISLALYLVFGALHARGIGPGGDEPHYLVITHSLLTDGDLLIENNHAERDYLPFFGGNLRPDYMRRGQDGQIYSIHAPGLPIVLVPVYAVGGYGAVVAFLSLIAALTALAIFDLAAALAGDRAAAVTWAATCLTVPFLPHAWMIFPELPCALVVAWASTWVVRAEDRSIAVWTWRGAALATLPWLHTKFILFTAVFAAALAVQILGRARATSIPDERRRKRAASPAGDPERVAPPASDTKWVAPPASDTKRVAPRASIAFAAPIGLSIAVWLYSFYVVYGTINPEAPYGDYPRVFVLMRNIPRGLLGLMFDQKFGLFVYAPVYLFAAAGLWAMARRAEWRWPGAVLLAATAVHVGSTTRLYMWWGGASAPARFLVPIVPCLAAMIAAALPSVRTAASRAWLWITLGISLAIAIASVARPRQLLLFSDSRGHGRIVEMVQGPAPLANLLPTFTFENWRAPLLDLAPWLAAAAIALAAGLLLQRVRPAGTTFRLATGVISAFVLSAALVAGSPAREGQSEAARRGSIALMTAYDPQRHRPFDYRELRRIDQTAILALSAIVVERAPAARMADQPIVAGPFVLPPGSYNARVWFDDARPREGEIRVSSSDRAVFGRLADVATNPVVVPFQLPATVGRLTVSASPGGLARAAAKIEIAPSAVVPPRERSDAPVRAVESIPGHPGAFLLYLNEHAYPEGGVFWTRGTGAASVDLAPGAATRMKMTLYSGPIDGDVRVSIAGAEQRVSIPRGQPVEISAAIPSGARLVPITVQAAAFFRPSEVEPGSADSRGLGCQVRIGLE